MAIVQCQCQCQRIRNGAWVMVCMYTALREARRGDRTRDRERIKLGLWCVQSGRVNGWRGVACHDECFVSRGSWFLCPVFGVRGMSGPSSGTYCKPSSSPLYDPSSLLVIAKELSRVGATGSTSPNARQVPTKLCPPTIYPLNTHNPSPSVGWGN